MRQLEPKINETCGHEIAALECARMQLGSAGITAIRLAQQQAHVQITAHANYFLIRMIVSGYNLRRFICTVPTFQPCQTSGPGAL